MLGLSTGLTHPDYTTSLIARYDFSDASKLKQNDDGTTAVSSDDDPIGYAENLVSNGLGTFVRSYTDAGRPLYKTGGANSKSYAQFDGSNDCGLVAGIQADGDVYGGISASVYSDVIFYMASVSIFLVSKVDVEDISAEEYALQIKGDNNGDTQHFIFKKEAGDNMRLQVVYGGDPATSFMAFVGETDWTTEDRLMSVVTAEGTNESIVYKNSGDMTAGFPREFSYGTLSANEQLDMRTAAGRVAFLIGAGGNTYMNPNSNNFEGRIYEVLIYNRSVTDAERILIQNYINTKYDLWS